MHCHEIRLIHCLFLTAILKGELYRTTLEDRRKSAREKEQVKLADLIHFSPFEIADNMVASIYFQRTNITC